MRCSSAVLTYSASVGARFAGDNVRNNNELRERPTKQHFRMSCTRVVAGIHPWPVARYYVFNSCSPLFRSFAIFYARATEAAAWRTTDACHRLGFLLVGPSAFEVSLDLGVTRCGRQMFEPFPMRHLGNVLLSVPTECRA